MRMEPKRLTVEDLMAAVERSYPDTGHQPTPEPRRAPQGRHTPPRRPEASPRRQKQPKPDSGRWQALNFFMDVTVRHLTPAEAVVWMLLFRDARGDIATAGIADLAERAGSSARWVKKTLVSLRKKKLVEVVKKGRSGRYVSTYRITPLLPAKPLPVADSGDPTGEQ